MSFCDNIRFTAATSLRSFTASDSGFGLPDCHYRFTFRRGLTRWLPLTSMLHFTNHLTRCISRPFSTYIHISLSSVSPRLASPYFVGTSRIKRLATSEPLFSQRTFSSHITNLKMAQDFSIPKEQKVWYSVLFVSSFHSSDSARLIHRVY